MNSEDRTCAVEVLPGLAKKLRSSSKRESAKGSSRGAMKDEPSDTSATGDACDAEKDDGGINAGGALSTPISTSDRIAQVDEYRDVPGCPSRRGQTRTLGKVACFFALSSFSLTFTGREMSRRIP